jgi:ABC-type ATPase with predicted acetyltransferase domain
LPSPNQLRDLLPRAGGIALITGPSGSGKSTLLRALRSLARGRRWIDISAIRLPRRPVVECFPRLPPDQALTLLSRVGLAEAQCCIRTPTALSDGQRWRLRLALALHHASWRGPAVLACDEFAALLDRVSACTMARLLRKTTAAHPGLCAVLATSHDDLAAALLPDIAIACDFGRWRVTCPRGTSWIGPQTRRVSCPSRSSPDD